MKKTILRLSCLSAIWSLVCLGGTYAYQTDYTQLINHICIGTNVTSVTEVFPTPDPLVPGADNRYEKQVSVVNETSVSCFIRVCITYSDADIGDAVTLTNLNLTDWTYCPPEEDALLGGYYYYHNPVAPQTATSLLFDGIQVSALADYSSCTSTDSFEIDVYEESVQQGDLASWEDAWKQFLF